MRTLSTSPLGVLAWGQGTQVRAARAGGGQAGGEAGTSAPQSISLMNAAPGSNSL